MQHEEWPAGGRGRKIKGKRKERKRKDDLVGSKVILAEKNTKLGKHKNKNFARKIYEC